MQVVRHCWGDDAGEILRGGPVDLVIACEVVYNNEAFSSLIQTLRDLIGTGADLSPCLSPTRLPACSKRRVRVAWRHLAGPTAMQELRIVTLGLARGDRKCPLNERQIPNFRGVRVHVSTGYTRVEGNRRASRNGLVSSSRTRTLT
jgi:hypothetical protein